MLHVQNIIEVSGYCRSWANSTANKNKVIQSYCHTYLSATAPAPTAYRHTMDYHWVSVEFLLRQGLGTSSEICGPLWLVLVKPGLEDSLTCHVAYTVLYTADPKYKIVIKLYFQAKAHKT